MTSPRHYAITVVMAARNAAPTIAPALESVASQDFNDFHIVVVDDHSTDSTADIVESLRRKLPVSLSLVSQSHDRHGYADALRTAFTSYCHSDYVICCDADDVMLPGALKTLYDEARRTGADIVMGPMKRVSPSGRVHTLRPRRHIASLNDMPLDTVHFSLCNKLMHLSPLVLTSDAGPFAGIDRWADLSAVSRMIALGARVATIRRPVYRYVIRPGSLSKSSNAAITADRIAMTDRLTEWFAAKGLAESNASFLRLLKFHAKVKYARNPGRDLRLWRDTYPEINSHILTLRHVPLHYRILFHLAARLNAKN